MASAKLVGSAGGAGEEAKETEQAEATDEDDETGEKGAEEDAEGAGSWADVDRSTWEDRRRWVDRRLRGDCSVFCLTRTLSRKRSYSRARREEEDGGDAAWVVVNRFRVRQCVECVECVEVGDCGHVSAVSDASEESGESTTACCTCCFQRRERDPRATEGSDGVCGRRAGASECRRDRRFLFLRRLLLRDDVRERAHACVARPSESTASEPDRRHSGRIDVGVAGLLSRVVVVEDEDDEEEEVEVQVEGDEGEEQEEQEEQVRNEELLVDVTAVLSERGEERFLLRAPRRETRSSSRVHAPSSSSLLLLSWSCEPRREARSSSRVHEPSSPSAATSSAAVLSALSCIVSP
jgi:hypothetical protein